MRRVFGIISETGRKIEKREQVNLSLDDFDSTSEFYGSQNKVCRMCGYEAESDFDYCPKCGTVL